MYYRRVAKHLGIVCLLIGASILFSIPWGHPALSNAIVFDIPTTTALVASFVVAGVAGLLFLLAGRNSEGKLYRREAMAIVGLSWVLATLVGALTLLAYRDVSQRRTKDDVRRCGVRIGIWLLWNWLDRNRRFGRLRSRAALNSLANAANSLPGM